MGACEVWVRAWFGGGVDGVIWFGRGFDAGRDGLGVMGVFAFGGLVF